MKNKKITTQETYIIHEIPKIRGSVQPRVTKIVIWSTDDLSEFELLPQLESDNLKISIALFKMC